MHLAFDIPFVGSHETIHALAKLVCPCGSSLVFLESSYPEPWESGFEVDPDGANNGDVAEQPVGHATCDLPEPKPDIAAILAAYPAADHPGVHTLAMEVSLAKNDVLAAEREAERAVDMHAAFAEVVLQKAMSAMGDHDLGRVRRVLGDIRALAADALGNEELSPAITTQFVGTKFGVSGTHWTIAAMVKSLLRSLGEAPNYVEFPFDVRIDGAKSPLVIRVERVGGKTPSQLRDEAEAALASLRRKHDSMVAEHHRVVVDMDDRLTAVTDAKASLLADFLEMEDALQTVISRTSDDGLRAMARHVIMANGTRTKSER